ncbi:ParB N-terminal domain-containing protein [Pseudogemmobacter sonorensis]|uniref:ParB N-terminal domain-containing protein n=1 Tax=Pseudogemmobacter sonorensis TaxID=2989681 RepID=UPI00368A6042
MARKRLSLPSGDESLSLTGGGDAPPPAPGLGRTAGFSPAPIAQVAGDAAARAALEDLAAEVERARVSGRMIQAIPLAAVDETWLHRDRMEADPGDMEDLIASIRARGQQAPVELVAQDGGRYGLISGWRRLRALRQLHGETGEARFATVLAILRRPETSGEAYRAMVEENEIRSGLSYYERARIAALAAEAGAFTDARAAIAALFAAASKAKRSKIGSFLSLHAALGDRLRFGSAIPERLGLKLAQAIAQEPEKLQGLRERLLDPGPVDAAAELGLLQDAVAQGKAKVVPRARVEIRPGLWLETGPGRAVLTGESVDPAFQAELMRWLGKMPR